MGEPVLFPRKNKEKLWSTPLEKVGILWQSGDVYPAQEHFVSFLIRQKIIAATDHLSNTYNPEAKKFLLFLPEGDWHEIALLFSQYLIREANHEVIYLGQSVPYSDVLALGAAKRFDYLLFSSAVSRPGFDLDTYLKDLSGAFPEKEILYTSRSRGKHDEDASFSKIVYLEHIEDLSAFLKEIS